MVWNSVRKLQTAVQKGSPGRKVRNRTNLDDSQEQVNQEDVEGNGLDEETRTTART